MYMHMIDEHIFLHLIQPKTDFWLVGHTNTNKQANMPRCIAITNKGDICTRNAHLDNERCNQHIKSYRGPLNEQLHELKCMYMRDVDQLQQQNAGEDMLRERMIGYHQAKRTLKEDVELNLRQDEYIQEHIRHAMHQDTMMLHWGYITRDTLDILAERYRAPYHGAAPNIRTQIWTIRAGHGLREADYAEMTNRQNGNAPQENGNAPQLNRIAEARRMRQLNDADRLRIVREAVMRVNAERERLDNEIFHNEQLAFDIPFIQNLNFADRWIQQNQRRRVEIDAPLGELQQFAGDAQNVHTTTIVNQTKEIVQKIREVPVPPEYMWTATETSKTPFEIGLECKLSQRAALQMMTQYSQDTEIYEMEAGIYGKTLDSVWQYIKASPDRRDLCKILKQEMEDNIGMCAQGNLSRLCNILAGYMDGVKQKESTAEILGRLFPKLMEMDDEDIRVSKGVKILVENNVPEKEWQTWLEPLRT